MNPCYPKLSFQQQKIASAGTRQYQQTSRSWYRDQVLFKVASQSPKILQVIEHCFLRIVARVKISFSPWVRFKSNNLARTIVFSSSIASDYLASASATERRTSPSRVSDVIVQSGRTNAAWVHVLVLRLSVHSTLLLDFGFTDQFEYIAVLSMRYLPCRFDPNDGDPTTVLVAKRNVDRNRRAIFCGHVK